MSREGDVASRPDEASGSPQRFAALRHKPTAKYIGAASLGMMGDNIEHVITYWVIWQLFQSPLLAGFAVVSHWLPHLFLSVYFGGLADRYDCRRIIQAAQVMFILASVGWGVMFITGIIEPWMCCVLLVVHGLASSIWHPAEQVMLYDVSGRKSLNSAVRLNATGRNLGMLAGPVVGGALLLTVGPEVGILFNTVFFLPMTVLMMRTKYTGHSRDGVQIERKRPTLRDVLSSVTLLRGQPVLISMMILGAACSLFIGAALPPVMPEFAEMLGVDDAGMTYTVLLAAMAAGSVFGGILLEMTGVITASVRVAVVFTAAFGVAVVIFAMSQNYVLSVIALLVGGFCNLVGMSTELTIVQLVAPSASRGTVLGLHGMATMGARAGSGVAVGTLGALHGVPLAIGLSSGALVLVTLVLLFYINRAGVQRGEIT